MQNITILLAALLTLAVRVRSRRRKNKITIGLVAQSQSTPCSKAGYAGAKDAAKELGPKIRRRGGR